MSDDIIKVGAGVCLGYFISKMSINYAINLLNNVIKYYNIKEMKKDIEKRRIVDIMGDDVGYLNHKNEIVKNIIVDWYKMRVSYES